MGGTFGQSFYGGANTATSCFCNSNYVAPYLRYNRDYRELKRLGFYFNDSTYLNASDPNSMRDQGMVRNAEYNIVYPQMDCPTHLGMTMRSQSFRTSSANSFGQKQRSTHNGGANMNQTFYSFGGKTPIASTKSQ